MIGLRVLTSAAGLLTVVLIPRLMGPTTYGEFAFLQTVSLWFSLLSGFGTASIMTRHVPEFLERGDSEGLRRLAGGMLSMRIAGGCTAGLAYLLLTWIWVPHVEVLTLAAVACGVTMRTAANLPFAVLLGMNRAAHAGVAELLRRVLIAPAAFGGFQLGGLRGACVGLMLIEFSVLVLGLSWGREFLSWTHLRVDRKHLSPYLRLGGAFFAANLLVVAYERMGGPLIQLLTGNFAEVGFYSVAFGVYLTGADAFSSLLTALGPYFSRLNIRGELTDLRRWLEHLLTAFGCLAVVACGTAYAFGADLIRLGVGAPYEHAAPLVFVFSMAGIFAGPEGIAQILAVAQGQARVSIIAAALQLIVFGIATVALFPWMGSLGVAVSVLLAVASSAGVLTWGMRQRMEYSILPWAKVTGYGAVCAFLLVFPWVQTAGIRWIAFVGTFVAGVLALKLVSIRDLRDFSSAARAALKGRGAPPVQTLRD